MTERWSVMLSLSDSERENLSRRMGRACFEKRMRRQALLEARETHQGTGIFALDRFLPLDACIETVLKCTGMYSRARRNFLDVQLVQNAVQSARIPRAFDGFRILQVSDLHCDLDLALTEVVIEKIRSVEFDFAVFTGDYHNKIGECYRQSLDEMGRILPSVEGRACGVFGNHDFLEKVSFLESCGLRILLNENLVLRRGEAELAICGVDDPQFFRTEDLVAARRGVGEAVFSVLLCHSPKPYAEAEALGYDLMLCGHTHGGQICLPGGFPVIRNTRCPRRMIAGAWAEGAMQGYTSRGTGGCGVAARFFCPPEITLHVLHALA